MGGEADVSTAMQRWSLRWGAWAIALAVLVTYWPLSTFTFGVGPHDTINCWLPWRWLVAQSLQDGHLPSWAPYHQFGYPLYADLQGPSWNIEAIALGGTVGHTAYTLQVLFLAYVTIGGVGMMRFSRTLHGDPTVALVTGMAYALGGFFTGHQMHFYTVISAAWLPWCFDAVVRMLRTPGVMVAVEAAVVHYLLLTGGNHTFTIMAAYLYAALVVAYMVRAFRINGRDGVLRILGAGALALGLVVLLACGTLYALWEVTPRMSRGDGLDLAMASVEPFTVGALRSLFMPYAVGGDRDLVGTDAPMANGYMGVLVLVFACLACLRRCSWVEYVLLAFGGLAALAAFGPALPVHGWLWAHVPGMDLFRFPAYFRWFTWLAVVVLAGGSLRAWFNGGLSARTVSAALWVGLGCTFIAGITLIGEGKGPSSPAYGLFEGMRWRGAQERAVWCLLLTAPALGLAAWLARRRALHAVWVLALVFVEMGWNTTLAQWDTAVSDRRPALLQRRLNALPEGPVVPVLEPMRTTPDDGSELHYLMYNTQDYLGQPVHGGYNSFRLAGAEDLASRHPALLEAMGHQPLVYFADSVMEVPLAGMSAIGNPPDSGLVVIERGGGLEVPSCAGKGAVRMLGFDHGRVRVGTERACDGLLVLQQAHYPGWQVHVDDRPASVLRVNTAAMATVVPAGAHVVEFRFHKPELRILSGISMIGLFSALILLAWGVACRWTAMGSVLLLAAGTGWSLMAHRPLSERIRSGWEHVLPHLHGPVFVNTDRPDGLPGIPPSAVVMRCDRALAFPGPYQASDTCWWVDAGSVPHRTVHAWLMDRTTVVERVSSHGVVASKLAPRAGHPPGRVLLGAEEGIVVLDSADAFTPAWEQGLEELGGSGTLVVDLTCRADGVARAAVVMEVVRDGRKLDHRYLPVVPPSDGRRGPAYAVVDLAELHRPGATVRIYLWHQGGRPVEVEGLRIRKLDGPL